MRKGKRRMKIRKDKSSGRQKRGKKKSQRIKGRGRKKRSEEKKRMRRRKRKTKRKIGKNKGDQRSDGGRGGEETIIDLLGWLQKVSDDATRARRLRRRPTTGQWGDRQTAICFAEAPLRLAE